MGTNNKAALRQIFDILVNAIGAAGAQGIPAGHLYAMLMAYGMTLEQFNTFVDVMVGSGKVRKSGHLLIAA
jgi:hypothetical protein